jgi:hypothetical protein
LFDVAFVEVLSCTFALEDVISIQILHSDVPFIAFSILSEYLTMSISSVNILLFSAAVACGASVRSKAPEGAIVLPLTYNGTTAAYYAPFHIGTPPQTEYLKVDTGSPTFSFLDPRNSFCEQSNKPCARFGTFDNLTSS